MPAWPTIGETEEACNSGLIICHPFGRSPAVDRRLNDDPASICARPAASIYLHLLPFSVNPIIINDDMRILLC